MDEPTPNSDPTGAPYAFEKGATKAGAERAGRTCGGAHRQLLQYAGALENSPLLVTSDIERITTRTNWTNAVSERHEVRLEELADPVRLGVLKSVFADPERLRPGTTRAALTAKAAAEFAEVAGQLRTRGNAPQAVAHFVNRLVFCLFADGALFRPMRNNRTGRLKWAITADGVYKLVRAYSAALGFEIGAHALRATAATNALDHQAEIAKLQEWLGHTNIASTRIYDRRRTRAGRQPYVQGGLLADQGFFDRTGRRHPEVTLKFAQTARMSAIARQTRDRHQVIRFAPQQQRWHRHIP